MTSVKDANPCRYPGFVYSVRVIKRKMEDAAVSTEAAISSLRSFDRVTDEDWDPATVLGFLTDFETDLRKRSAYLNTLLKYIKEE